MIGELVTLAGAVLVLLSAVGVIRFPDALARMHALTKASTVGVVLVAVGSAFVLPTANDITSALAAALLQILTLPISASLLGRATYLARGSQIASTPSTSSPTSSDDRRRRTDDLRADFRLRPDVTPCSAPVGRARWRTSAGRRSPRPPRRGSRRRATRG